MMTDWLTAAAIAALGVGLVHAGLTLRDRLRVRRDLARLLQERHRDVE